ncbi:hypothetical protein LJK87_32005 [Paenibacillus sp. P25]|nr:hypothetical protein LJK87_32005 [Paenibacillus sp. P25]
MTAWPSPCSAATIRWASLLAAALFGSLTYGSAGMSFGADVPPEIIRVVIGSVIFFVAAHGIVRGLLRPVFGKRKKGEAA